MIKAKDYSGDIPGNITIDNNTVVQFLSDCIVLDDSDRKTFMIIYIIIFIISTYLNVAAIFSIIRRKLRLFQKTCIISLALSDLVTTWSVSTNNLETFSHPLINWTLGDFLCSFIPFCQCFGVMASSAALLLIAMDRYTNVVKAFNRRWNPATKSCILGTAAIWVLCAALSSPMFVNYNIQQALIFDDMSVPATLLQEILYFCVPLPDQRTSLMSAYISMIAIFFAPLLAVFFWFYYKVALMVWQHRRPPSGANDDSVGENSTSKACEPTAASPTSKNESAQVKRKVRTFKIIIVLIFAFMVCRLPYWIFTAMKLSLHFDGVGVWRVNYCIIALNIISCVLNPLLYTYINVTVAVVEKICKILSSLFCRLCCCCFYNEFEEYEKGNPFTINIVKQKQGFRGKKTEKKAEESTQVEIFRNMKNKDKY